MKKARKSRKPPNNPVQMLAPDSDLREILQVSEDREIRYQGEPIWA